MCSADNITGTAECKAWSYTGNENSTTSLIDTPGLNDQNRPDTEILTSIVDYILQQKLNITAVIYLHRITERKLTGSAILNLRILQAICGDHFLRNVVLVTSMWKRIPAQEMNHAIEREAQFNMSPSFWGGMIKKGAKYLRWDEAKTLLEAQTAFEIINRCEHHAKDAPKLNILLEMEDNYRLDDTTAYRILTEEARKRLERERREILEEQEEERRELQRQKAELESIASREQENVWREMENLERIERPGNGPGLLTSLTSIIRVPLQRRFSDVPDTSYGRDQMTRDERERERERDRDYESDQERRRGRASGHRSGSRPSSRYELAWVRKRRHH
jgi:hypothetical protein